MADTWLVQAMRLSLFSSRTIEPSEVYWTIASGQPEAESRTMVPGGKAYSGKHFDGFLQVTVAGNRLDFALAFNAEVRAGNNAKGTLDGVSSALVGSIRALQSKIGLNSSQVRVRSFCVLDYVLRGDYDSHATIHYGERTSTGLSEKQIKTIRAAARLELAEVFGPISPDAQVAFAAEPAAGS